MKSFLRLAAYIGIAVGLVFYVKPHFINQMTANLNFQDVLLVLGALICFWILKIVLP